MPWILDWDEVPLNDLATVWMQAPDPQAITDAANEVDRQLVSSPESKGVEFYGDRLIVVPPLHVVFQVDSGKHRVKVIHIWTV